MGRAWCNLFELRIDKSTLIAPGLERTYERPTELSGLWTQARLPCLLPTPELVRFFHKMTAVRMSSLLPTVYSLFSRRRRCICPPWAQLILSSSRTHRRDHGGECPSFSTCFHRLGTISSLPTPHLRMFFAGAVLPPKNGFECGYRDGFCTFASPSTES